MINDQLRKHVKPGIFDLIRIWFKKNKLGTCGKGVFFEKNTAFMRYPENIKIGDKVIVKEGARLCSCNNKATIGVGNNSTIGYHTYIFASEKIEIGNDCLIAPFVYIVDSNHGIEKQTRINLQPNITSPVIISDDVWIGTGAMILPGTRIGEGAVIAAGAVVNSDIPPYEIFGGIPAKKIGARK